MITVVGNLSQFAQSGETVPANRIWDLANNKVYDPAYRASRTEVGIKFMQDKFKTKFGIFPVIWGNNMLFPTSLTDPRIWVRRFENGIVVVNPTNLDENQIDLSAFGSRFYNPDSRLDVSNTVSLPEHTGMILYFNNRTAVDNTVAAPVSLFPNPTNDSVFVQSLDKGKYIVDIFNSTASVIRSTLYDIKEQNETIRVDLNPLSAGAYIIQIRSVRNNKVNVIKRIVKM